MPLGEEGEPRKVRFVFVHVCGVRAGLAWAEQENLVLAKGRAGANSTHYDIRPWLLCCSLSLSRLDLVRVTWAAPFGQHKERVHLTKRKTCPLVCPLTSHVALLRTINVSISLNKTTGNTRDPHAKDWLTRTLMIGYWEKCNGVVTI